LQYAVLAKCVNGAKASICAVLSVVIACRLTVEARTSPMDARRKTIGSQTMMFWKWKKMELSWNTTKTLHHCLSFIYNSYSNEGTRTGTALRHYRRGGHHGVGPDAHVNRANCRT
jgi:hypothetical protein